MHACCEIFSFSHSIENRENCSMECLANEGDLCCYDECFAEQSGIYVDEKFDSQALLNSLTRDGSVGEAEIAVVKRSIEKCEKAANKNFTAEVCEIPLYVYNITQCVFMQNYKNCPNVLENLECQKLGKVLDPCTKIRKLETTARKTTIPARTTRKFTTKARSTTKRTSPLSRKTSTMSRKTSPKKRK